MIDIQIKNRLLGEARLTPTVMVVRTVGVLP